MIKSKIDMVIIQEYYSLTLIVWCMKLEPKTFMKILVKIKKCLIFSNYSAKPIMIQKINGW